MTSAITRNCRRVDRNQTINPISKGMKGLKENTQKKKTKKMIFKKKKKKRKYKSHEEEINSGTEECVIIVGLLIFLIGDGLISWLNGMSTFVGYIIPNPSLSNRWYYLTYSSVDKGDDVFAKGIRPKLNAIA